MSAERNLISRILHEQDLTVVSDIGVTRQMFLEAEHRQAFEAIIEHQAKYSTVPPVETFRKDYPTYRITDATDAMAYYADEVVKGYRLFVLEDGIGEAIDFYDNDQPVDAEHALARTLSTLNQEIAGARTVDLTQTGPDRLERYKAYGKSNGIRGISTGFSTIDAAIGGMQRKQLTTFVGPPKAGKSTMMLLSMIAAHRGFHRPLFIGFEMSNTEQEERHDAFRAHLSHKKLREGRLDSKEIQALERMYRRLESMPPMIFSEDADSSLTLSGVAAQIQKYDPDCVYVDGVYMMEDEHGEKKGSPQALTNLTRGFKQTAKNLDLPIAISTQVLEWKMDRKRGVTSSSIGYSSSFIQDSDHIIAVERTDDPNVNKVKVVLSRTAQGMETFVQWNWETGEFVELEGYEDEEEYGDDPKF